MDNVGAAMRRMPHTDPSHEGGADPATNLTIINCMGLKCPMPIIQVRLALNALQKDAELIIYADDPTFSAEFLRFCQLADLILIATTKHPTFQEYHAKLIQ